MEYSATTGVVLYWDPEHPFVIHISHNAWFDEYNSFISIEDKHTPGYLLLQKYPESLLHNLGLLKFIPCELDLTSSPFCDKKTSYMKLIYLFLKRNMVLIYGIMKML